MFITSGGNSPLCWIHMPVRGRQSGRLLLRIWQNETIPSHPAREPPVIPFPCMSAPPLSRNSDVRHCCRRTMAGRPITVRRMIAGVIGDAAPSTLDGRHANSLLSTRLDHAN